uniref:F-box domain-containing protein n=1 Tax=Oryza glumipatula TaxID=40148 RepID=A0A0E0AUV8_9ORYZ
MREEEGQGEENWRSHGVGCAVVLQMKLQTTTSTTLIDLQNVAARIEERIYKIAIDFGDYLRSSLIKGDLMIHIRFVNKLQSLHLSCSIRRISKAKLSRQREIIHFYTAGHKEPFHPYGKDRISKLPNDLIHHIMSFLLSMKEAFTFTEQSRSRPIFRNFRTLRLGECP